MVQVRGEGHDECRPASESRPPSESRQGPHLGLSKAMALERRKQAGGQDTPLQENEVRRHAGDELKANAETC